MNNITKDEPREQLVHNFPHWQKIKSPISLGRKQPKRQPDAVPPKPADPGARVSPQSGDAELDAEICRLSSLAPAQYEHERKAIADRFAIRTTVLDKLVTAVRGSGPDERQGHTRCNCKKSSRGPIDCCCCLSAM